MLTFLFVGKHLVDTEHSASIKMLRDLVYHVEKFRPFISPPYLIWSCYGISLQDFDVTSGHLRKLTGNLRDIDHIR